MLTETPSRAGVCGFVFIFLKSESFAKSLKKALETGGYRGAAVTTESHAFSEAEVNVPSLIIVDRRSDSVAKFRRMRMLNRVPIVAVQEGDISCYDEECLKEYDRDIDLVVCGQSVREMWHGCAPSFDAEKPASSRMPR